LIKYLSLEGGNEADNNLLNIQSLENVQQIVIEEQQILCSKKSNKKNPELKNSGTILIINPFNESIPQDYLSKMSLGLKVQL